MYCVVGELCSHMDFGAGLYRVDGGPSSLVDLGEWPKKSTESDCDAGEVTATCMRRRHGYELTRSAAKT